jgi:zinc transport system permease protein
MHSFIITALLAGIGIAIISGPIGSLMIWRRMTYFGDTLAHATLLGVSIAALLNINIYYGLIFTCLLIAILLTTISSNKNFTNDTVLSILSHTILALGLISITLSKNANIRIDLLGYLYGDILSINNLDLICIYLIDILVIGSLIFLWDKLVFITIHKELAITEGINETKIKWIFTILVSLIFAVTIRLVGVLLINALLIIPSAIAKIWAKSPTQMAILGSIFGCITIILGIIASLIWDIPTGPAIVISAALLFLLSISIKATSNIY